MLPLLRCPCCCSWPSVPLGPKQQALELSLLPSPSRHSARAAARHLAAQAAPLRVALSPQLFSTVAAILNPLRAAACATPPQQPRSAAGAAAAPAAAAGAAPPLPPVPVRGSANLQGLSVRLCAAPNWEDPRPSTPSSSSEGSQAQPAAEVAFEEVALLVHQAAACEGRPWLGPEAGLSTQVEASLVSAEIRLEHGGEFLWGTVSFMCWAPEGRRRVFMGGFLPGGQTLFF